MNRSTPPSSSASACSREELLGLVDAGLAPGLDAHAERTDRAGHETRRLARPRRARDPRPFEIDRARLVAQAERAQLDAVGAERVGLDDVGAGAQVFGVNARDQVGCVRFSDSKQRLMKTPFAYSSVPIAPSQTSTRRSIASRKDCRMTRLSSVSRRFYRSAVAVYGSLASFDSADRSLARDRDAVARPRECRAVDQHVRPIDAVDADVSMPFASWPPPRDDVRSSAAAAAPRRRAPSIAALPTSRRHRFAGAVDDGEINPERLRRFVRQQHVDAVQPAGGLDLLAHEVPPLVGQFRGASVRFTGVAAPRRACRTTSARTCRRRRPRPGRRRRHRSAFGR